MSLLLGNISEIPYDTPTRDGEHDAMLVKYFVGDAEETLEIKHGLGRIPQQIELVWSDNPIMFFEEIVDGARRTNSQSAFLTFFESNTTVILRFS